MMTIILTLQVTTAVVVLGVILLAVLLASRLFLARFVFFLREVWLWMYHRLPRRFSFTFAALLVLYFVVVFPKVAYEGIPYLIAGPFKLTAWLLSINLDLVLGPFGSNSGWTAKSIAIVVTIISALLTIAAAVFGFLVSYWLAGSFYSWTRSWRARRVVAPNPVLPQATSNSDVDKDNPLEPFENIGIILAGGGAKGAYQAGAMQAIYDFLETRKALHKVKMIAGTSIGSWNAVFWLAGLMKPTNEELVSPLQKWWQEVNIGSVIQPARYVPTRQNYFLSNEPWKESFDLIFGNTEKPTEAGVQLLNPVSTQAGDAIHYYFTRTNIGQAKLDWSTNRPPPETIEPNLPDDKRPRPAVPEGSEHPVTDLNSIRDAVFSSMDLPPLFKYMSIGNQVCEDGGVIDNLPIRFGSEFAKCDLLFVLPLNAGFEEDVDQRSVIKRLARVTNIRQGVLERNSFKMIYLFNELACLQKELQKANTRVEKLKAEFTVRGMPLPEVDEAMSTATKKDLVEKGIAERAQLRTHKVTYVFCVCPAPELLINTTQFWKTEEAKRAFEKMRAATNKQLENFTENVISEQVTMLKVQFQPADSVTRFDDF